MTAKALSLDPAGRQPHGISGGHAAPPALAPERARELIGHTHSHRQASWAMGASLFLHLTIAAAALAAFGGETMGGSGGMAGEGEGSGILVELMALAPASKSAAPAAAPQDAPLAEETSEAEAPKAEAVTREVTLPPPPTDAEAIPLNVPPPEPVKTAKIEDKPKPVEKPRTEAKREAPKPAPAKAKNLQAPPQARPSDAASALAQTATADTSDAQSGPSANAGAPGAGNTGGAGGNQLAALGDTGLRILQARFRVTPPPPPYPRRALSQQQEGTVMVRCLIDEQGAAREIKLHASSGYPLLDKAALQAVGEWQFMPETVNGRAVAVWVEVPVRFQIN